MAPVLSTKLHQCRVTALAWSPDEYYLALDGNNRVVEICGFL
jgi:hypothetical protein